MSLNSSHSSSVDSLMEHPDNILLENLSCDALVKNMGLSSHCFRVMGTKASSSTIFKFGNPKINLSFVVDPPHVDSLHNLAIPPCNIEVFDGNIS